MLHSPTSYSKSPHKRFQVAQSAKVERPYFDGAFFILFPTILNLTSIQELHVSRVMVSVIFILALLKNIFLYSAISHEWSKKVGIAFGEVFNTGNRSLAYLIVLLLLFTVSEVRGGYIGTTSLVSYVGLFVWSFGILFYLTSVVALNKDVSSRQFLMTCLVLGFGLYILFNIIGYLFGLRGPASIEDAGTNKMLSLIGVNSQRVAFPFAGGLNNFGSMSGLTVVAGFFLSIYSGKTRYSVIGAVVVILGLAGVVLVDSRAALGLAMICCLVLPVFFSAKRLLPVLKYFPLLVLVTPLVVVFIYYIVQNSGLADYFARQGAFAQKLGLLSGRDIIWESAWKILSDPSPIQVFGYGAYGQFTSGATEGYAWVFSQLGGYSMHSVHNAGLQILFDIGYLGLIIWTIYLMYLIRDLLQEFKGPGRATSAVIPLSMLVFILLAGVFEICGTPAFPDVFAVLIFLTAWSMPLAKIVDSQR